MSTEIDNAFIKQFEREVHEAYQRQGSKLRNTVRTKNNVKGESTTFQKVGKGAASSKTRHGLVPTMNLDHTPVECTLADKYAGDWVDKLDELKINIDERQVVANAGAYALGRDTDDQIITAAEAADGNANDIAASGAGMTKPKALSIVEAFGDNDVPDDGQRFAVVGWKQWTELLAIDEFVNSDYVGATNLPFAAQMQNARSWLGIVWIPHSGLTLNAGTDVRTCLAWHKSAIGHASGADITTDITWHGDRAAHFVNSMMSQGAKLIDTLGVVPFDCDESP